MDETAGDTAETRHYRAFDPTTGSCVGVGTAGRVRARIEDRGIAFGEIDLYESRGQHPLRADEAVANLAAPTPLRNRLTDQKQREHEQDALNDLYPGEARSLKAELIRCAEGAHAEYPMHRGHWNRWSVGRMEQAYDRASGGCIRKGDVVLVILTPGDRYSLVTVYSVRLGADVGLGHEYDDAVVALGSGEGVADQAVAEATRTLLLNALHHDAVDEAVTELLFEHVVRGRCHWTVIANSLAPILEEVAEVADATDWAATAEHVHYPAADVDDPEGLRRSDRGTDFPIATIRAFLRAVAREPIVRVRLRLHPDVEMPYDDKAGRAAAVRMELSAALRSGTEEDWNIVAGQLIAAARAVCGTAVAERF